MYKRSTLLDWLMWADWQLKTRPQVEIRAEQPRQFRRRLSNANYYYRYKFLIRRTATGVLVSRKGSLNHGQKAQ